MTPGSTPAAAEAAHAPLDGPDSESDGRVCGHASPAERAPHDAACPGGVGEQAAQATQFASLAGASVPCAKAEEATGGDATEARPVAAHGCPRDAR